MATDMSKEAMQQALKALELNRRTHYYCEDTWYSCPKHEDGCANEAEGDECNCGADQINAQIDNAITAIREALAEQAQQKPFGYIKPGEGDYEKVFSWNRNERNGYTQAVYTTPQPQPAQPSKPVGKLCVIKDVSGDYGYTYDISTDDAGHDALRGMDGATLYTTPQPQRKPLTDEQIDAAVKAWFANDIVAGRQPFAKRMRAAIKAAYGIKEQP